MSYQQLEVQFASQYYSQLDFAIELMQAENLNCCSFTISNGVEEQTLDDAVLEPEPGETPLWDYCSAQLIFLEPVDRSLIENRFKQLLFPTTILGWSALADKPWEREWLQHCQPILIGDETDNQFWISARGHNIADDKPVLWLDPGLAFGTGDHETTYLCLQWLASQSLGNQTIVDFGCGSGILALAALLQGAKFAHCHDIDPQALTATLDNAQRNQIDLSQLTTTLDYRQIPEGVSSIVLANILFEPLKTLAPILHRLTANKGKLCLSGLIQSQVDELIVVYQPYFTNFMMATRNDWVRISALKC